jgi:hypothetical protein
MAEVKTIKDIDEPTWAEFKSMAARNKTKLGMFFKTLVEEHKKTRSSFWSDILDGEKILSDKEAYEMKEVVKNLRKEKGYRI